MQALECWLNTLPPDFVGAMLFVISFFIVTFIVGIVISYISKRKLTAKIKFEEQERICGKMR